MKQKKPDGRWEWTVRVVSYGGEPMGVEVTLETDDEEPPKSLTRDGVHYERAETDHLGRHVYREPRAIRPRDYRTRAP